MSREDDRPAESRSASRRCLVYTKLNARTLLYLALIGVGLWYTGVGWLFAVGVVAGIALILLLETEALTATHFICLLPLWRISLAEAELTVVSDPQFTPPRPVYISVRQGLRQGLLDLRGMSAQRGEETLLRLREACPTCREETFSASLYGYTRRNPRALVFRALGLLALVVVTSVLTLRIMPSERDYILNETARYLNMGEKFAQSAWDNADWATHTAHTCLFSGVARPLRMEASLASRWYRRALQLGDPAAGIMLLQLERAGFTRIPERLRQQWAEEGFRHLSCFEPYELTCCDLEALAICYLHGFGVAPDPARAEAICEQLRHDGYTPCLLPLTDRQTEPSEKTAAPPPGE